MYLSGRHDIFALGFVCTWLALGVVAVLELPVPGAEEERRGVPRWLSLPALALLTLLVVLRLAWTLGDDAGGRHRAAAGVVAQAAVAGDVVIATGIRRLATQYNLSRALRERGLEVQYWRAESDPREPDVVSMVSFPTGTDRHPGWSDVLALLDDEPALADDARELVAAMSSEGKTRPRSVYTLDRAVTQVGDAVSATWLVDRYLHAALGNSGYEVDWHDVPAEVRRWQVD